MTKEEALELLKDAPYDDKPSRLNPILTQKQAVDIVLKPIEKMKTGEVLDWIFEKRVYQVTRDQKRPRY